MLRRVPGVRYASSAPNTTGLFTTAGTRGRVLKVALGAMDARVRLSDCVCLAGDAGTGSHRWVRMPWCTGAAGRGGAELTMLKGLVTARRVWPGESPPWQN